MSEFNEDFAEVFGIVDGISQGPGFVKWEEYEESIKRCARRSKAQWVDILLDLLLHPPEEKRFEAFSDAVCEFLGPVLAQHPDQLHKLKPLLEEKAFRESAFLTIVYSGLPDAWPLLEPFVDQVGEFEEQEVVEFLEALPTTSFERTRDLVDRIRIQLAPRVNSSEVIKRTLDWFINLYN